MTCKFFLCTYPIAFIRDSFNCCCFFVISFYTIFFQNWFSSCLTVLKKPSAIQKCVLLTFSNKLFCFVCVLSKYKQIFSFLVLNRCLRSPIGSAINAFGTKRILEKHKKKQTYMRRRKRRVHRRTQWEVGQTVEPLHRLCHQLPHMIPWDTRWVRVVTTIIMDTAVAWDMTLTCIKT